MTIEEEIQGYIAQLDSFMLLENDDDVLRATYKLIKGTIQPHPSVAVKGAILRSKSFTDLILRFAWILESNVEMDRVLGKEQDNG